MTTSDKSVEHLSVSTLLNPETPNATQPSRAGSAVASGQAVASAHTGASAPIDNSDVTEPSQLTSSSDFLTIGTLLTPELDLSPDITCTGTKQADAIINPAALLLSEPDASRSETNESKTNSAPAKRKKPTDYSTVKHSIQQIDAAVIQESATTHIPATKIITSATASITKLSTTELSTKELDIP